MTKKILLAAAAASAMAFAGAANAHTLTFRTTATPNINGSAVTGTGTSGTGSATTPYKLAVESTATTPTSAIFELNATLAGGSFPSGNNFIQIDLTGGTFSAALNSSAVTAAGCTVVLSSGGAVGSSTAKFLVSSSGGTCNSADMNLPIKPNAASTVTVTTTLTTEAGSPIDPDGTNVAPLAPNQESLLIVSRPSAFNAVINGAIGAAPAGALTDTFATLTVTPVYTTFKVGGNGHAGGETATVGQLGTVEIYADTTAYRDLAKNVVAIADVTGSTTTVTGSYAAFAGAGGAVTLGGIAPSPALTTSSTSAVFTGAPITTALVDAGTGAAPVSAEPFIVTRQTAAIAIPTSSYTVALTYTLDPAFYIASESTTGSFETIQRDGTNVIVPWLNSNSIQAVNGTSNIIRLGNTSSAPAGPVYAQVLNSTATAGVATAPVQLFPNIAANGERVISTATLTSALGEFGRGDVQISVEAPANTITARRYATLANGSVTEVSNGSVASDQTGDSLNNGGADVP